MMTVFSAEKRASRRRRAIQKWGPGYVLVAPATVLVLAMMLWPLIQTLRFSVSDVQLPLFTTAFVGLDNFIGVFKNPDTVGMLVRTLTWVVGTVALRFILGLLAALIFNARVKGTVWLRILVMLPWTLPSVVAANLWRWVFQSSNGILNQTLEQLGVAHGSLVDWLGDPSTAMGATIVAYSWAGFPFIMLLLLAGMQGIPQDQFEAAKVDGSNAWQTFRFITVPSLRGVMAIALVLETVSAVNSFDTIKVMTGGGPANATEIWSIGIYNTGFQNYDFGTASAMSVLLFIAAALLFGIYVSFTQARNARRKGTTS
jgi:ABC-type sugar transport system permease subunit